MISHPYNELIEANTPAHTEIYHRGVWWYPEKVVRVYSARYPLGYISQKIGVLDSFSTFEWLRKCDLVPDSVVYLTSGSSMEIVNMTLGANEANKF